MVILNTASKFLNLDKDAYHSFLSTAFVIITATILVLSLVQVARENHGFCNADKVE